jgi:hypothetical protein
MKPFVAVVLGSLAILLSPVIPAACIVVNGKYRINMDTLQSQDDLIGLVRYLVDKESRHL